MSIDKNSKNVPLLLYKVDLEKNWNTLIMVNKKTIQICHTDEKICYIDVKSKSRI